MKKLILFLLKKRIKIVKLNDNEDGCEWSDNYYFPKFVVKHLINKIKKSNNKGLEFESPRKTVLQKKYPNYEEFVSDAKLYNSTIKHKIEIVCPLEDGKRILLKL